VSTWWVDFVPFHNLNIVVRAINVVFQLNKSIRREGKTRNNEHTTLMLTYLTESVLHFDTFQTIVDNKHTFDAPYTTLK
jgi:hypothetical protein